MLLFRFIVNGCRIINAPLVFISKIENEDLKLKVLTRASLENINPFYTFKTYLMIKKIYTKIYSQNFLNI